MSPSGLRYIARVFSVVALVAILPGGASQTLGAATPDGDEPVCKCGKARALLQRRVAERLHDKWQAEYETSLAAGLREALTDTDLLHCDLEVEIMPGSTDNLAGTNTMTIQSTVDNLTQFTFRLRSQFTVDNAVVNGGTPVVVTTLSTTSRVVTLDRAYDTGEIFTSFSDQ